MKMVAIINFIIKRRQRQILSSFIVILLIAVAQLYYLDNSHGQQTKRVLDTEDVPLMTYSAVKQTTPGTLGILVLSRRDAFDNREAIRNTWSYNHTNVFFMVAEHFCPYPPDARVPGTCRLNDRPVSQSRLEQFQLEEELKTKSIRNESQMIMLPVVDEPEHLSVKVVEAYRWAFTNLDCKWILNVFDDSFVKINLLEDYLLKLQSGVAIIGPKTSNWNVSINGSVGKGNLKYLTSLPLSSKPFIVAKSMVKYSFGNKDIKHQYFNESSKETPNGIMQTKHMLGFVPTFKLADSGNCLDESILVIGHTVSLRDMLLCQQKRIAVTVSYLTNQEMKRPAQTFMSQKPTNFLLSSRFDIIVKIVYAHFYSKIGFVPKVFKDAYTENIRVWNQFKEDNKSSENDFINAFHKIIESIKENGFVSEYGRIPVNANGFPKNGAHRIAAAIVLSENVTFKQSIGSSHQWDYLYFLSLGFKLELADAVMLQWMIIQQTMPALNRTVSILSLFSKKAEFTDEIYRIVKAKCSLDNGILYEKTINVNKVGMEQLVRHNYGNQSWIGVKIRQMVSKVTNTTHRIRFIFFFGRPLVDLNGCKLKIRQLYSEDDFKSAAHITDSANESLILAEMILNPNSVEFLNYGKNGRDCQLIAEEIASRLGISMVNTLPGIYIGREDFMIDSGTVLNLFNLRNRTDVDILFLKEIEKSILGSRQGVNIEAHEFKENAISYGRAWGEDHFSQIIKTKWDLFYDPRTHGYCYGIKFVSLKQLIEYKMKRAEVKDKKDVSLMEGLIKVIQQESLQQG